MIEPKKAEIIGNVAYKHTPALQGS